MGQTTMPTPWEAVERAGPWLSKEQAAKGSSYRNLAEQARHSISARGAALRLGTHLREIPKTEILGLLQAVRDGQPHFGDRMFGIGFRQMLRKWVHWPSVLGPIPITVRQLAWLRDASLVAQGLPPKGKFKKAAARRLRGA